MPRALGDLVAAVLDLLGDRRKSHKEEVFLIQRGPRAAVSCLNAKREKMGSWTRVILARTAPNRQWKLRNFEPPRSSALDFVWKCDKAEASTD